MSLGAIREGGEFPRELAFQLPYPEITTVLILEHKLSPSSALMQRSAYNPSFSPKLYDDYNIIITRLHNLAKNYGKGSGKYLARLFVWSEHTTNETKPGQRVYALKVSDNPAQNENEPEILFMGAHHGNEMNSVNIIMALIEKLLTQYAVDDKIQKKVNSTEAWFIPVVNPNGYIRSSSQNVEWRKNTRKADPSQNGLGVDINRNYDFEHLSQFTVAVRKKLSSDAKNSNGLQDDGTFYIDCNTYPGNKSFSETETQAVAGLVDDQFITGHEVDGIKCTVTWHSYGGYVMHPMGHIPKTTKGLSPSERLCFETLATTFANASGYQNLLDSFPRKHYPTYGEATDWLLKKRKVYGLTIESYGPQEGNGTAPHGFFNPGSKAVLDQLVKRNVDGALAFMSACPCTQD
jgi:hypothetical protein